MEAIMAAAIAIDAFYASVSDKTNISQATKDRWREKRTARYRQVSELLRQAFRIRDRHVRQLSNSLKYIYLYRDWAVHPSGQATEAVVHPELNIGVEQRVVAFRAGNAVEIVTGAFSIVYELLIRGRPCNQAVETYAAGLTKLIDPIAARVNWPGRKGTAPDPHAKPD